MKMINLSTRPRVGKWTRHFGFISADHYQHKAKSGPCQPWYQTHILDGTVGHNCHARSCPIRQARLISGFFSRVTAPSKPWRLLRFFRDINRHHHDMGLLV